MTITTEAPTKRPAPIASRSTWKGTVSFGLVSVNVAFYSATQDNDIHFKQVHTHDDADPGLVKQKRVCAGCAQEVPYDHIEKAYDAGDRLVVLTKDDLAGLPLETTKSVTVQEFVPLSAVDPILFQNTYYLAPQDNGNRRAYALLRDAMADTGRAGVVKVAMRSREQVALLYVRDGGFGQPVLALTTLRWADEVRHAAMPILGTLPESSHAELELAKTLVTALSADGFDPDAYEDGYRYALEAVIEAKSAGLAPLPEPPRTDTAVKGLMETLLASVERAKTKGAAA